METNQQYSFIRSKIEELGSAIFYNQSDAVLKLPTSVITHLKADEFGYVWFYVQKPNQHLQEFETEFPVRLDFFRKGLTYYLQIEGNGWVVTDPEEINTVSELAKDMKPATREGLVLVKVKILKADYHETKPAQPTSWWDSAVSALAGIFGGDQQYRTRHTYFPAS